MVNWRAGQIRDGDAPDDLATSIMTTCYPNTGDTFSPEEMVDQVAIFLLAGHETSAFALAWAIYLLATHPDNQQRVADEAYGLPKPMILRAVTGATVLRDAFRETLRLHPPVPMMVRQASRAITFRNRPNQKGRADRCVIMACPPAQVALGRSGCL